MRAAPQRVSAAAGVDMGINMRCTTMRRIGCRAVSCCLAGCAALAGGCGSAGLFNAPFVNFIAGGQFPVTPGPTAPFVFVRVVNDTSDKAIEFIVTIERSSPALDEFGGSQFDENGNLLTESRLETVSLRTFPLDRANEVGTVFACNERSGPVIRVGLGENLGPLDPHLFVFENLNELGVGCNTDTNPLSLLSGKFNCGDTIIFQAFDRTSAGCGVGVKSFLLPGTPEEQPAVFAGPSTFEILNSVFEGQVIDEGGG